MRAGANYNPPALSHANGKESGISVICALKAATTSYKLGLNIKKK